VAIAGVQENEVNESDLKSVEAIRQNSFGPRAHYTFL
jgi:hypothetical protein